MMPLGMPEPMAVVTTVPGARSETSLKICRRRETKSLHCGHPFQPFPVRRIRATANEPRGNAGGRSLKGSDGMTVHPD